jgi:hypothetical protein
MKTLKPFFTSRLASLQFSWQVIRYVLIFVSAFFRQRASLGCELVAFEVSSLSIKKVSDKRDNLALDLTRHFVSCGCCCQECGADGSLQPT